MIKKFNFITNDYNYDNYIIKNMQLINYKNYKKCKIEDIDKYPDENFYYAKWYDFLAQDVLLNNKKISLDNNIINLLQTRENFYLMGINEQEVTPVDILYKLQNLYKLYNIKTNKIFILDNNYKNYKLKKKYNLDINLHTIHLLSLLVKKINIKKNINVSFKKDKKILFLCQNNKPRSHRISLLILLDKYNIINDVDWSLLNGSKNINHDMTNIYDIKNLLRNESMFFNKETQRYYKHPFKKNNFDHIKNYYNDKNELEWTDIIVKESFENSYFNIVTETEFNYSSIYMHITEKSFKPFAYYQYPLLLAAHHHIKYMKLNYDFDFFDDVIDHSYDNIINNSDRLFKFVEEIKRIQENKDFFIKFYEENQDRFLENHKKYMNLNNQHDIDFFNSLI